jgi:hypothetical protein
VRVSGYPDRTTRGQHKETALNLIFLSLKIY